MVRKPTLGDQAGHPQLGVGQAGPTLDRPIRGTTVSDPDADPSKGTAFIGINTAGVRVGAYTDTADILHGIIQIGNTTTLLENHPNVPANASTFIFDINNLGQMVGGYFDPVCDIQHGLLTDLGSMASMISARWWEPISTMPPEPGMAS